MSGFGIASPYPDMRLFGSTALRSTLFWMRTFDLGASPGFGIERETMPGQPWAKGRPGDHSPMGRTAQTGRQS
jgi:hypothetical protein